MALVVNILTLEITEHKLYQIVVGVLNFDPWPQQQALLTQRFMLNIYGKQLRKCWDGQLSTTLFLDKSPEVNLPVHVLSDHFSPVTGSLLFLKQLIPKREIDTSDTYFPCGTFQKHVNPVCIFAC